ncbi:MAG: cytochrome C biogenesis protein [Gammaproteobacteria bacterium HGW-Gammaproteobacteria-10]|nr:MAG: cytochrome C biogenesis protein [Gammaproteobacteria bacterium HGW-Gammaproteobacteria-10]
MLASFGVYGLSIIAGILSTLSPCVLPLVPILVGTALSAHRLGPLFLAFGLALSFTVVGLFLATVGVMLGLDQALFRNVAAVLLIAFGLVLLSGRMQQRFAAATSGLSGAGQPLLDRISGDSLTGQFLLGLVLGVVWSPCVGPTLGATMTLASQGENLTHAAVVMALFGIGAGLPLILLGSLSQQAMLRFKGKLSATGKTGKWLLGGLLLILGTLILTGLDKTFEAWVLLHAPERLTRLTTSI